MGVVVIMREPLKLVYSRTGDVPHPIARGLTNPKHLKQKKFARFFLFLFFGCKYVFGLTIKARR